MFKYLEDSLRKFLNVENVSHIENNGSRTWKETVKELKEKPMINVVFSRYQGTEISETVLGKIGYVLAIPSYWIDIDYKLTCKFVSSYINKWLRDVFKIDPDSGEEEKEEHHCIHPIPPCPPPGPIPPCPPPGPGPHPPHPHKPQIEIDRTSVAKFGYPVDPGE